MAKKPMKTAGSSLIRSLNIYDYEFEFSNLAFINDEQTAQLDNVVVEACDVLLNITGASVAAMRHGAVLHSARRQ